MKSSIFDKLSLFVEIQWKNVEKDPYLVAGNWYSIYFLFHFWIEYRFNISDIYPIVVFSVQQNQVSETKTEEYFPISLIEIIK